MIHAPSVKIARNISRWGWLATLLLLVATALFGALQARQTAPGVAWESNLASARLVSKRSDKPLLVVFQSPLCGWCRKLNAETLRDAGVIRIAEDFVCARVESEMDAQTAQAYRIDEFPISVVLTPKGEEIGRLKGYASAPDYQAFLTRFYALARQQSSANAPLRKR